MAKTRKSNFRYFYKSKDSGNIYSSFSMPNRVIEFAVAGTHYQSDLKEYIGEFMGKLVPEPDNEQDPNAILVEHTDGHHIGYVPKEMTQDIRDFKGGLPCDCYCFVQRRKDQDGDYYYFVLCYVSEYPIEE